MAPADTSSGRTSARGSAKSGSRAASRAESRSGGVSKSASKTAAGTRGRAASGAQKTGAAGKKAGAAGRPAGRAASRGGPDAVQFLKQDHRRVDELFSQFEEASDGRTRASIVRRISQALLVHTQIEEELFYPAAREEMSDHDLLNEAKVEHDSLKKLIAELEGMRPSEELYKAKVTVLKEYVKHHVKEEERELFPEVKKTDLDLAALGEELSARWEQLMKGSPSRGRRRAATTEAGVQART